MVLGIPILRNPYFWLLIWVWTKKNNTILSHRHEHRQLLVISHVWLTLTTTAPLTYILGIIPPMKCSKNPPAADEIGLITVDQSKKNNHIQIRHIKYPYRLNVQHILSQHVQHISIIQRLKTVQPFSWHFLWNFKRTPGSPHFSHISSWIQGVEEELSLWTRNSVTLGIPGFLDVHPCFQPPWFVDVHSQKRSAVYGL